MFARSVLFDIGFNIKKRKLEQANKEVSILKRNVKSGSSHFATIGTTGYSAGDKLRTAFASVGSTLKSGVATLRKYRMQILGVTAAFGFFTANAIKQAGDAQETINKFNVVFGNTADETRKWATNWADAVGRSRIQTLDWLNSFQDILVPMGLARNEAGNLSKEMVKLAGDLGSFNNVPTARAARAMQSALMGQHRAVRKLGISLNQARLDALAMSEGYGDSFKNLDALTKMQLRFQEMIRQSQDAVGDLKRTKKDFNNQLLQLKGNFKDASAEMGKNFIPTATKVLQSVNKILRTFKDPEWAEFGASISGIGLGLGALGLGIPVLAKIAGFIKTGFVAAFTGAAGIISATIGIILAGWALLDDALTAFEGGETLIFSREAANNFIDTLDNLQQVIRNIGKFFLNTFKVGIIQPFKTVINLFKGENIGDLLRDHFIVAMDTLISFGKIFKHFFGFLNSLLKTFGINLKDIFTSVWNWIKTAFKNVIQFIGKQIANVINNQIQKLNKLIGVYNSTIGKVTGAKIGKVGLIGKKSDEQTKTNPVSFTGAKQRVTENQNFTFDIRVNGSASTEEKRALDNQLRTILDEYVKQNKAEVQG